MFAEEFVILLFTCTAYTVHVMIIICSLMGWEQQNKIQKKKHEQRQQQLIPTKH